MEPDCNMNDCFLCRHCLPEWKEAIAVKKKTWVVKKGKPVFREGEKVEGIFFIFSGLVKVHKKWLNEKDLIIRFSRAGDLLGHRGLGDSDYYPISATTLTDTKVCYVGHDFFEATLKTNQELTYYLMHLYAGELQKAEKRMRDLAHMEVKGRLANALLEIQNIIGMNQDKFFDIDVSRQDIASYAGTTYETVFKFFNEIISAGIISVTGKRIRIDDQEKLRAYIDNRL